MRDLIIIGAGPAGLAASREAKRFGLDFLVLDRGLVADTVHQFPIAKPLFSTANELELIPGGLACQGQKPTREELLTHYMRFVVDEQLPIHTNEPVTRVARIRDGFCVTTAVGEYHARAVLVATGINGERRRLGVPGETDDRVRYRFVEAFPFAGKRAIVVGSGNSAAEVALFLEEVGAKVTLVTRRPSFGQDPASGKPEIKWWVREPLEERMRAGSVDVAFSSRIAEITPAGAIVEGADGSRREIESDEIFALLGTLPDLSLLVEAGVAIDEDAVPHYDPRTFETNVRGLFVAGHVTRERHMKGALAMAPRVVGHIVDTLGASRSIV